MSVRAKKLSHIQQKSNELIEQYQKSLETLKKPLNVKYEHETEKVGGFVQQRNTRNRECCNKPRRI
ncbi:plasmid recombination enzyme type 3 (Plasmid recombinase)(Mobilization protein) [Staphylococcus gallinarum]|uniref:Plasmid recombination enzyme type 3 (Plasmid recombinase)(Mobilization protein) n=1 Tax=Staphylococcus gallinarum TaxID=1293 RepID=A0A380SAZ4_STAGA|nr:plasmid recombination enzyme type 3 (Plasmid recombinase)(Mobilization protein) [Staphylococcus gallinarum]